MRQISSLESARLPPIIAMPLRPAAATRRLRLAMERGERPFREGHSIYLNRIEGQVRLRTADGNLTNAGREYIRLGGDENATHLIPPTSVPWHQGRNAMAYAIPDRHGAGRTFLIHRETLEGPHALTHAGRLFQGHEIKQFVVKVPVYVRYKRANGDWSEAHSVNRQGEAVTVPMDKIPGLDGITDGYADDGDEAIERDVKAATMEHIRRMADTFGDGQMSNEVVIHQESDCYYFVKTDEDLADKPGWKFDAAITRRSHGRPETHVILNRPLRGIIDLPDEMWGKMKLLPEAIRDFKSEGLNCVVQQVAVAFTVRHRPRDGDARTEERAPQLTVDEVIWHLDVVFEHLYPGHYVDEDGNRINARVEASGRGPLATAAVGNLAPYATAWKKQWSGSRLGQRFEIRYLLENIVGKGHSERNFGFKAKDFHRALREVFWQQPKDRLEWYTRFFKMFPELFTVYGDHVAAAWHHYEEEKHMELQERWSEPKAEAYRHRGWRELGPDSRMVIELCRRLRRRCRIIHDDVCIYDYTPENWEKDADHHRNDAMVVWAVWGDHCLFYQPIEGKPLEVRKSADPTEPVLQTRNELDGSETAFST